MTAAAQRRNFEAMARKDAIDVHVEDWPNYVLWTQAGLMAVIVLSVGLNTSIPHRGIVVALAAIAATGCWLELAGIELPDAIRIPQVFIPLGIINVGAERLGFDTEHGDHQVTLLILVFFVGEAATRMPKRTAFGVLAAAVGLSIWAGTAGLPSGDHYVWTVAMFVGGAAGLFMRALVQANIELRAAQGELAEKAATEERQRIAREVHDVIAHSLTVTMLHVTAARLAVNRGDGEAATEALEEAERSGRQSLAEVRRTVGLLRDEKGGADEPPAPHATDLERLIESFRAAGQEVELLVAGDLELVPPHAGLALYRIVQESLTNVGRHTPGAKAAVRVTAGQTTTVSIRSAGGVTVDAPGTGTGTAGMRERAEALGGRVTARADGSGWLVEAVLPGRQLDPTATVVLP
ncbi:MAG: sensor histidine kinase [Acidimicrobiales bacterium]